MALENLPAVFSRKVDGSIDTTVRNENPITLVVGTSPSGTTEVVYTVDSPSVAASNYGKSDGTLVRGMYEALAGGAQNIHLFRIGATSAVLETIGTGVTLTTNSKDDNSGTQYNLFWDDTAERLRVWRTSDDLLVYDNSPAYPSGKVDQNEVSVSGTVTTGSGDIGTLLDPITMAAANAISGAAYTAGTDGIDLSRMELYEALFKSYKLLDIESADIVVPMNAYVDDVNTDDMTTAEVTTFNTSAAWAASSTYPEANDTDDGLGKLFAQEYLGEWYFWWDMDRDGVAEVYPTVGSASASTDASGEALIAGDFHPVNFGYQLANFCFTRSQDDEEMMGSIGMLPPNSWSLSDIAQWMGSEPVSSENASNLLVITTNGTGLLGNRWMAGRLGNSGTGLPGHVVDGVDGRLYGGFVGTDSGWIDGTQQKDRNEHIIDIGKYLTVVGAQAILANVTSPTSYVATGAAIYAGFMTTLPANSAPTNKILPGVRLPFTLGKSKVDTLAGYRYTMFHVKSKGLVVSDAPTAARPDSDYQRVTTVKIVMAVIDALRAVADPFLGEGLDGAKQAALETAIDGVLSKMKKSGYLIRADSSLTVTPRQRVLGQASLDLVLVPAYELRQLTVTVALAAQ